MQSKQRRISLRWEALVRTIVLGNTYAASAVAVPAHELLSGSE